MEMYIVEAHMSNAARMHGQNIRAVEAKKGRKYLTVSLGRYDHKFDMEPETDINGNIWHREVSEYSADFVLYETVSGAEDYLRREGYLDIIRQHNFNVMGIEALADVVNAINDFREKKRDERREAQQETVVNAVNLKSEIENLKAEAKACGAELILDESNFIDANHLDCTWYGRDFSGALSYNGYVLEVIACGEVRIYGSEDGPYDGFSYVNKGGTGTTASDDIRQKFHSDAELFTASERGEIHFENNNWLEYVVVDEKSGDPICEPEVADTDNLLEFFTEIQRWIDEVIEPTIKASAAKQNCTECDAENCAFNPKGICKFPLVYGTQPEWDDHYGCKDMIQARDCFEE